MNLNKDNMRKIKELIVFTIVILIGLWNYKLLFGAAKYLLGLIFPFLVGGAIAFILNVPMNFLEDKLFHNRRVRDKKAFQKMSRPVSLILTILLVIGIIALVMFVVIPELGKTFISLGRSVRLFIPEAQRFIEEAFSDNSEVRAWIDGLNLDLDKIINSVVTFLRSSVTGFLNSTVSVVGSIVSGVTTFVIAFVFACYILLQKETLTRQVKKTLKAYLTDEMRERFLYVCSMTYRSFSNFLTGQCLEAVILGSMFFVTMNILRMPYSLLVGILIAFTALIPIFGAFIGCIVGAFLILVVNPWQSAAFVIMFLVLQQIEGNLIYPRVVGSSVGLPSIWVLAAVTIGGNLMGVVGMLVFIPLVSVVYNLFRENVNKRLAVKEPSRTEE